METKLPKRKCLRLKYHDYNMCGSYFVTFCTYQKRKNLAQITENENGNFVAKLTPTGEIVDAVINSLPLHLGVEIDKYVIMPNHIHLIVVINPDVPKTMFRSVLSKCIGYIKMNASKAINQNCKHNPIWQRGYHDHVVRGEYDYKKIADYIYYNPLRWKNDCYYAEY